MTITPIQIAPAQYLTSAIKNYYTSTNIKTRFDKVTATNNDPITAHTVSIYLVPFGTTPSTANLVVNARSIAAKTTYHFPEIVGHIIGPGDSFQVIADVNNIVSLAASGVTISP